MTPTAGTTPRPWINSEECPVCWSTSIVRLPADWQQKVDEGWAIPIVACGNPWHYSNISVNHIEAAEAALTEALRLMRKYPPDAEGPDLRRFLAAHAAPEEK